MTASRVRRGPLILLFALDQQASRLMARAMAGAPLRPDEFAVYSWLRLAQPCTAGRLAADLGMRPSTLSNYLKRMTEHGHLHREVVPADRRSALLSLSPAGLDVTEQCFPYFGRVEQQVRDNLEDLDGTLAALERLSSALETTMAALAGAPSPGSSPDGVPAGTAAGPPAAGSSTRSGGPDG